MWLATTMLTFAVHVGRPWHRAMTFMWHPMVDLESLILRGMLNFRNSSVHTAQKCLKDKAER